MSADMPILDGYGASARISKELPYIGIILFGAVESIDIVRHAMQSGAGDFLDIPLSSRKILNSISTLYAIKQEEKKHLIENPLLIPNRQPKIISIFSSKGGVGKTIMSTNLAVALREQTRDDVLLVDLDLQFGDVTEMLNVNPRVSIIDLISDLNKIEEKEINNYFLAHSSGIKILAAPQQPEQADRVGQEDIKELFSLFIKSFDYIIVDLPPLFNETTLGAIQVSDYVLVVTTMEVPTLKNIKSSLEILAKLEYPKEKIKVVINRYKDNNELKIDHIKKYLGVNKAYCVEDDMARVIDSINSGEPLIIRHKKSSIAKQIMDIGTTLIEYKKILEEGKKSKFLSRLFHRGG
jgi:pilus assembly protein CpaE